MVGSSDSGLGQAVANTWSERDEGARRKVGDARDAGEVGQDARTAGKDKESSGVQEGTTIAMSGDACASVGGTIGSRENARESAGHAGVANHVSGTVFATGGVPGVIGGLEHVAGAARCASDQQASARGVVDHHDNTCTASGSLGGEPSAIGTSSPVAGR